MLIKNNSETQWQATGNNFLSLLHLRFGTQLMETGFGHRLEVRLRSAPGVSFFWDHRDTQAMFFSCWWQSVRGHTQLYKHTSSLCLLISHCLKKSWPQVKDQEINSPSCRRNCKVTWQRVDTRKGVELTPTPDNNAIYHPGLDGEHVHASGRLKI